MHPKQLAIAAFAAILTLGCDSPPGPSEPGAISITLSPQTLTIGRGANDSIAVTVQRTNFNGAVTLTVEGTPPGVSAFFEPSSVPAGVTRSVLRVSSTAQATFAVTTLTIKATAEGVATQAASFSLSIVVRGDYSLSVLRPTVTVAQGGAGSATVLVSRLGFSGNVSLGVAGVPAGITATLDPPATPGSSVALRLTATPSATPGTYTLIVTGATEGLTDRTATFSVVVIAPPSTASLTFEFCTPRVPIWFAFQNEGYSWQQVTGTGTTFTFAATEKFGLAWVFQSASAVEVMIHYSARSEHSDVNLPRLCSGTKALSGSVASLASDQVAMAAMGASSAWMNPSSTSFTLQNVPAGPLDLVAARGAPAGVDIPGFGPEGFTPDRMIIRRSLDVASGATMPVLDFASSEAFAPAAMGLTITGFDPSNVVELTNRLRTATPTSGRVHSRPVVSVPTTLYSVPAEQLAAGDLHELRVTANASSSLLRTYVAYFVAPADRTDALGPFVGIPSVTGVDGSPYARMRGQLPVQPEYGGAAKFIFGGLAGASRNVHVGVTAAYLGGTPTMWDVLVPDLSGTAGFQAAWMPTGAQAPAYQIDAYSTGYSALAGGFPLFRPPKAGDIIRYSVRAGAR